MEADQLKLMFISEDSQLMTLLGDLSDMTDEKSDLIERQLVELIG